jgi:hypothetical protein
MRLQATVFNSCLRSQGRNDGMMDFSKATRAVDHTGLMLEGCTEGMMRHTCCLK